MKRVLVFSLALAVTLLTSLSVNAQSQQLKGIFITEEEDGKVQFYQRGAQFIGKLIWSIAPTKDVNNPDPAMRNQNTVGQEIFFLEKTEDNEWEGEVYNSQDGRTYSVQLWFDDQRTLKIRGYIGHPLLGQTATMYLER
ncbi:MAG TPA: hypothetical protein DCE41_26770 [Cytophagales bacterium]|nr:hypothetical protein [Cytophagales bacterium]HAA21877.1 hypothetical protein [Cytophagales bacterium]HAP58262.1 hypothetical protein [Cytophagales bacterium]